MERMSKRTLLGIAIALSLLAGCLSQTVSEEGGWDPAGRVRVNGLYQSVTVYRSTGDTDKIVRVFYRFRNDGTFQVSVSQFLRPFYPDSVVSPDTTSRYFNWWEQRGNFLVTDDSIRYFNLEHRYAEYNDMFLPWETDSVGQRSENIAEKYRLFTNDTWITHWRSMGGSSMGEVGDSSCIVRKRIGDENMAIPWAELRP